MPIQLFAGFLVRVMCFSAADALCSFRCASVNTGTFMDEKSTLVFSCTNTSIWTINEKKKIECYITVGAFLVIRKGNKYRCIMHTTNYPTAKKLIVYRTPFKPFSTEPSICDVCTGTYTLAVFVAKGENLESAKSLKPPSLGCTLPPVCPKVNSSDEPCTGCEPKKDDGLACSECITCENP